MAMNEDVGRTRQGMELEIGYGLLMGWVSQMLYTESVAT